MFKYILKRVLGSVPTLFLIVTLAFFLVRTAPGGPFDSERALPAEIEANLNATYHLDDPLIVQYLYYIGNIIQGDFGPSFQYKDFTVTELIFTGFPISLTIGISAIILAFLFGSLFGAIAALYQNSKFDYIIMGFAMTGVAIPNFVMAPVLSLILGVYLSLLPTSGWGTPAQAILPIVALTLPYIAAIARLMRGSMIEVLNSNWIRTARAKGVCERDIILKHAFKASILPVVSFLGPATAGIITGSVVVEQIFSIPGIGRYFVQGALNRDYTLVMGVVVFYGVLIVLFNLIVDLLYATLDPKIKAGGAKDES